MSFPFVCDERIINFAKKKQMEKKKSFESLNRSLRERKDMIRRGEEVRKSRVAVHLIERKIAALKKL